MPTPFLSVFGDAETRMARAFKYKFY